MYPQAINTISSPLGFWPELFCNIIHYIIYNKLSMYDESFFLVTPICSKTTKI